MRYQEKNLYLCINHNSTQMWHSEKMRDVSQHELLTETIICRFPVNLKIWRIKWHKIIKEKYIYLDGKGISFLIYNIPDDNKLKVISFLFAIIQW